MVTAWPWWAACRLWRVKMTSLWYYYRIILIIVLNTVLLYPSLLSATYLPCLQDLDPVIYLSLQFSLSCASPPPPPPYLTTSLYHFGHFGSATPFYVCCAMHFCFSLIGGIFVYVFVCVIFGFHFLTFLQKRKEKFCCAFCLRSLTEQTIGQTHTRPFAAPFLLRAGTGIRNNVTTVSLCLYQRRRCGRARLLRVWAATKHRKGVVEPQALAAGCYFVWFVVRFFCDAVAGAKQWTPLRIDIAFLQAFVVSQNRTLLFSYGRFMTLLGLIGMHAQRCLCGRFEFVRVATAWNGGARDSGGQRVPRGVSFPFAAIL